MAAAPVHIFIVDDNVSDASLLMNALKRIQSDIPVYTLSDSRILPAYLDRNSPIEALRTRLHPDLLILQVSMPHYSGMETLKWIRSQSRFDTMIVIMFASYDDPRERTRFQEAGADLYIVRPTTDEGFTQSANDIMKHCLLHTE